MTDHNNHQGGVQKGHAWREFALAPEMVRLPSGNYLMGENEEDKFANATERPRHRVEINYSLQSAVIQSLRVSSTHSIGILFLNPIFR